MYASSSGPQNGEVGSSRTEYGRAARAHDAMNDNEYVVSGQAPHNSQQRGCDSRYRPERTAEHRRHEPADAEQRQDRAKIDLAGPLQAQRPLGSARILN